MRVCAVILLKYIILILQNSDSLLTFCVYSDIIIVQTESEVNTIGRPKLPDTERRKLRLDVRLTAEEMKLLDKLADRFKLNKTQTILKALELLANQK